MKNVSFLNPASKKTWVILLTVLSLAAITVSQVAAYANVYINSYTTANLGTTSTYGPNSGTIFANVIQSPIQSVEGRNANIIWTSGQLSAIASATYYYAGPVFHVFSGTSGNCVAPFAWNGYLDYPTSVIAGYVIKTAKCAPWESNYNNEVRIYFDPTRLVAGTMYWGETHFNLASGSSTTGHVANDVYYVNDYTTTKVQILNGTWCFTPSSGPYNC